MGKFGIGNVSRTLVAVVVPKFLMVAVYRSESSAVAAPFGGTVMLRPRSTNGFCVIVVLAVAVELSENVRVILMTLPCTKTSGIAVGTKSLKTALLPI